MTMTDKELADELLTLADYIERGGGSGEFVFVSAEIRDTREAAERLNQLSARVVELEGGVEQIARGSMKALNRAKDAESALAAERATRGELIAAETERCAKIADVWSRTKPDLARSDNPTAAAVIATVASETGTKIAALIRSRTVLHSPEGKQPSPTGEAGK